MASPPGPGSAFEESAELVLEANFRRGNFLDGGALAAQELGRRDLPTRLEAAWRDSPSMPRLRRWLGSAGNKARVRKLANQALEACPKRAGCQRALLHLVLGDFESAARCLSVARGLGWSDSDHPGHLLFSLFPSLLEGQPLESPPLVAALTLRRMNFEEFDELEDFDGLDGLEELGEGPDEPRLRTAEVGEILETAGVRGPLGDEARTTVLSAMRAAAGKRVAGVIKEKRRRHYDHAARLVGTCASLDSSASSTRWVQRLRARYSRYPALQRELDGQLGQSLPEVLRQLLHRPAPSQTDSGLLECTVVLDEPSTFMGSPLFAIDGEVRSGGLLIGRILPPLPS